MNCTKNLDLKTSPKLLIHYTNKTSLKGKAGGANFQDKSCFQCVMDR